MDVEQIFEEYDEVAIRTALKIYEGMQEQ